MGVGVGENRVGTRDSRPPPEGRLLQHQRSEPGDVDESARGGEEKWVDFERLR